MTSFPTIASAARDIAAKRISPVELMKDHLARSEKLNPTLHAFIRFTPEIALEQAQAAESAPGSRCAAWAA
jgi:aspartyl-tRNA(Asn)/glutamyl-tRNA(Gln) amidotransferase subunit A